MVEMLPGTGAEDPAGTMQFEKVGTGGRAWGDETGASSRPATGGARNGVAEFLRQTVTILPKHIRMGLVRRGYGFGDASGPEAGAGLAV